MTRKTSDLRKSGNKAERSPERRVNDPVLTRKDIIEVATREFAEKGLSGSRIDEIAERMHKSKRMIYYYFESKEALFREVLAQAYRDMRAVDSQLRLEGKSPLDALSEIVKFTFDHHVNNQDFIRLVAVENIHRGENIAAIPDIVELNSSALDMLRKICETGVQSNIMRNDVDPVELHMTISSLCFFYVANRYTFSKLFSVDMTSSEAHQQRREQIVRLILRYVVA